MHQIRWFAPNRFCTLPVPRLREGGLTIATEGDAPAQLAFAADGVSAVEAWAYAWRHRVPLAVYLWDLPPWQVGRGGPNPIIPFRGRLLKVPRLWGAYPERNGYYSRVRNAARRAIEVWAPSANSQQEIERYFEIGVERVPFCFDSDRFHRGHGWHPRAGEAPPTVLSVSRLVPYKNHVAVIRAASLLTSRARVRIIGRGPEAGRLRALAAELDVDLQLDEARQSDREMVDAYRAASVVVCPSRFEGIGLTPLEGAAMGVPTIASDIPTHREFAAGHVELIALDDDEAMAGAIERGLASVVPPAPEPRHPIPDLTIEACAARFLPRLEDLLRATRVN